MSLRKMEKARKARTMNPPAVAPTMRMVLVLLPLELDELEFWALEVADVVGAEEVDEA